MGICCLCAPVGHPGLAWGSVRGISGSAPGKPSQAHSAWLPHHHRQPQCLHVHERGPTPPQPEKSLPSSEALLNQVGISQKETGELRIVVLGARIPPSV